MSGLLLATPLASSAPAEAASGDPGARFTLAVMPDTQFYSRYSASQFEPRYGTDPFAVQTKWLAEHRDELNIPFVAHLGDIVDQPRVEAEWVAADAAMSTLDDAGLPYSILAGNHDVLNSSDTVFDDQYDLAEEPFVQWFPVERTAEQLGWGGADATGFNRFHTFEAAGQEFLMLSLGWRTSTSGLEWAQGVLDAHPTLPVILTTHSLLNIEADGVSPREDGYGLRLWNEFIAGNDQIFLTFNGHFHGSTQLVKTNDFGNSVTQVLMDYQMAYEGGNGYLGLVEFDLTHDTISVQTASPWVVSKPQEALTTYDQAFLEEPNQQYELSVDFAERFAGFAPEWEPGAADLPSLNQRARDILLDGFTGPDPVSLVRAGNSADYVPVDGTLAHWRFGEEGVDGVVAEGQSFADVAGASDLRRVPIAETGSATAQVDDVTLSADVHPFSADTAAVCFAESDTTTGRFSYLATDDDAPVNAATLDEGYTLETFLKIDPNWSADENGWMKAIVRSGNRSGLEGMPVTRWDYTASPAALGLSNLKEFQWTEVPAETTKGDRTAWSGEIMVDRWMHVALVNDPESQTTTMYVDGAPVLRNTTDTLGHSIQADMPWIFGSDFVDDAATNGWSGCIGETRVIDHPTSADQWLTARPSLDGLAYRGPSGEIAADAVPTELDGAGTPGATVSLSGDLEGQSVVRADGSWSVPLDAAEGRAASVTARAAAPGSYAFEITQGFGARTSPALAGDFTILAAPAPGEVPGGSDGGGDGSPGGGTSPGAGDGTTPAEAGAGLANTGSTISAPGILIAVLALLLGTVTLIVVRRRGPESDATR